MNGKGLFKSINKNSSSSSSSSSSKQSYEDMHEDEMNTMIDDLRRGPWTDEEDHILSCYISKNGEGRWNTLARLAGLNRTGKSCRLRWLNYLRPDVRRGNISLEEQLLILDLHSRWGNRWSKIAKFLPGRTDNEIKNYWRTRVQKHAKQLKCDVNSQQFKDTMKYLWMPRLVERIQAATNATANDDIHNVNMSTFQDMVQTQHGFINPSNNGEGDQYYDSSYGAFINQVSPIPDLMDYESDHFIATNGNNYNFQNSLDSYHDSNIHGDDGSYFVNPNTNPNGYGKGELMDYGGGDGMQLNNINNKISDEWMMMMMQNGDVSDYNLWDVDDFLFNNLQQQEQYQQQQFNNCAQNY